MAQIINRVRTLILFLSIVSKKIVKKNYEQFHANKLNNLDDMDKYLETQTLSKLNYEKTEILNKSISSREIELVIRNLTTKGSGPDGFIGKHLKKN